MKLKKLFYVICLSTLLLILLSTISFVLISFNSGGFDKTPYLQLYTDVLRTIIVVCFVGLASILIPEIIQKRRYEFEMRKEAKRFYSESLTGVMYLSSRLPYLKLVEDAFKHLEELHSKKHLAETYYEYLDVKNKTPEFEPRRIWPPHLDPGKYIEEVKSKVVKIAGNWSEMTEKSRFDYLNNH
jgi:hypothetical protein